jgi:hypothetical protein
MSSCTACGHQLGVGRFCTNCGAPVDSSVPAGTPVSTPVTAVDWRTDTAERRLPPVTAPSDPRTPPAATAPPPPPRYPLFADELDTWTPGGGSAAESAVVAPPVAEPAPAAPEPDAGMPIWASEPEADVYAAYDGYAEEDARRSPWLWILVALLGLALVVTAWWFLVRDDGSTGSGRDDDLSGTPTATVENDDVDVARRANAKAPETAPPNQDVDGQQVSYDASNMLDGVPETAWRATGDGTGLALRFTLREATELHQVGLVNGYAKTSGDDQGRSYDWYLGNRRITEVVWLFQGGVKVRQQLGEDRELQMVDIDPVTTRRVVLRLVGVTSPGEGTASRNFTAISEVSLMGTPDEG